MADTIFKKEDKPEVDKIVEFLKTLTPDEQKAISYIMQGMKLRDVLAEKQPA